MKETDYLIKAYEQDHFISVNDFLSYVKKIFGEGLLLNIHTKMCNKYGLPKLGTGRVAYISKTVVFKVPISEFGFRNNDLEASIDGIGLDTPHEIPIAKSRHLPKCEIPIVVMEKVEEANSKTIKEKLGEIPSFVNSVDMEQVGFTKKGKLVAFDYADL